MRNVGREIGVEPFLATERCGATTEGSFATIGGKRGGTAAIHGKLHRAAACRRCASNK